MRRRAIVLLTTMAVAQSGAFRAGIEALAGSKKKALAFGFLLVTMLALSLLLVVPSPAHAKTFTVSSTLDTDDGACSLLRGLGLECTLREAIKAANNASGQDTINFKIFGGGVKTIKPNSELPTVTERVTIDAYSQPGASENTLAQGSNAVLKIELSGVNTDVLLHPEGLVIDTSDSVVRGLVINGFSGPAIHLSGSSNKVEGNFIGTDASGTAGLGNTSYGVFVGSGTAGNIVGGTSPAARNVISGNGGDGVLLQHTGNNKIQGNLIGTTKDGISPLGNLVHGVAISGNNNTVGGTTSGAANVIAFSGLFDGVTLYSGTGNRMLHNSIHSNGDLGIDLVGGSESIDLIEGADGSTANDPNDPDTGANNLQNKPVLTSATNSGVETSVKGKLNSKPNKTFTVEFFSNPPDTGEGKKYVGQKSVTTNAEGNVSFTFVPANKVPVGQNMTATATDPDGNTSEFSAPRTVAGP
jgi:CSLREA domain-containing protein